MLQLDSALLSAAVRYVQRLIDLSRHALESVPLRKEFVPGFSLESPAL